MKKIIITCIIIFIIIISIIFTTKNKTEEKIKNGLTKITVAEVTHSIFYAPQYLADSLGYFKEEGLDVEIILASGADAVMSAVLSGEVDIGFCGTEATI
jgi:NitT/TauT family transport system substrate-binding protein